ncbi:hypothetical protein [Paenibacillus sp. MDMC362]|uniref:hypothetical protein n=1 Tax=Paenibacillus sp. MDMC362 TaxID=2977365 RepID=UPI000DC25CBB|nr:hypothetical protein [Paenibacillus sp. MDMC362]RAR43262.1 hypothetical protein DP091_14230 [Paenibacillus sp. MDMC362]
MLSEEGTGTEGIVSFKEERLKKYRWLLLMTLQGIDYLFINNYVPMYGVILAFKNFSAGIFFTMQRI